MKNLHLISTEKPSRLHLAYDKYYYLSVESFIQLDTKNYKSFNIYITNSKEIKEGVNQWYIDGFLNKPRNSSGSQYGEKQDIIILTTDQDLIKDGVQAIDDEFLEWFVKNANESGVPFDRCEVEDDTLTVGEMSKRPLGTRNHKYKIIIPKEEPKDVILGYKTSLDAQMLNSQYVYFSNPNADKITSASTTSFKQETIDLEISDKEIENEAERYETVSGINSFKEAIKWYREKLKLKKPKLNLPSLESKLDEALSKETEESLTDWVKEKRSKPDTLEELAERPLYFELVDKKAKSNNTIDLDAYANGVQDGVKWQVDDIIDKLEMHIILNEDDWSRNPQVEFKSFIKQFKNK